jgi:hypothetical protein
MSNWSLFCHNYNIPQGGEPPPEPGPIDVPWQWGGPEGNGATSELVGLPPPKEVNESGVALSIQGSTLIYVPYDDGNKNNYNTFSTSDDLGATWQTHPISDPLSAIGIDNRDGVEGSWNYRNNMGYNNLQISRIWSKQGELIFEITIDIVAYTAVGAIRVNPTTWAITGLEPVGGLSSSWSGGNGSGNTNGFSGSIAYSRDGSMYTVGARDANGSSEGLGYNATGVPGSTIYVTGSIANGGTGIAMTFGSTIFASVGDELNFFGGSTEAPKTPPRFWEYGQRDVENDVGQSTPPQWQDPHLMDNDPETLEWRAQDIDWNGNPWGALTECTPHDFLEPQVVTADGILVGMGGTSPPTTVYRFSNSAVGTLIDYAADITALTGGAYDTWKIYQTNYGYYYLVVKRFANGRFYISRSFSGVPGSFTGQAYFDLGNSVTRMSFVMQEDANNFYFAASGFNGLTQFTVYHTPNLFIPA